MFKLSFLFWIMMLCNAGHSCSGKFRNSARKQGDYIIGGIFTVHLPSGNGTDKDSYAFVLRGLVRTQAFQFAIDRINKDPYLLPNITLGYDIRDDFGQVGISTAIAFDYVDKTTHRSTDDVTCESSPTHANLIYNGSSQILAVVGPASSTASLAISPTLGIDWIPVISYSATSRLLSNKIEYRSFMRTVPSDDYQIRVMIDIIEQFQWNYVAVFATDDAYGHSGLTLFEIHAKRRSVCIALKVFMKRSMRIADIRSIVAKLKSPQYANMNVVVVIMMYYQAASFIQAMSLERVMGKTLIASESWADSKDILRENPSIVRGIIGVSFGAPNSTEFDEYKRKQRLFEAIRESPWLEEWTRTNANCTMFANKTCISKNRPSLEDATNDWGGSCMELSCFQNCLDVYGLNASVKDVLDVAQLYSEQSVFVIDAVLTIAHGLHVIKCNASSCKNSIVNRTELFNEMITGSYPGIKDQINFYSDGDRLAEYTVANVQLDENNKLHYVAIGNWSARRNTPLQLNTEGIVWNDGRRSIPTSSCSADCPPGTIRLSPVSQARCCWTCQVCPIGTISQSTNSEHCLNCSATYGNLFTSDINNTNCFEIHVDYLHWTNYLAIIFIILSVLLTIVTSICLVTFIKYRNTPIVKGSHRNMMFLLLIMLCTSFILPLLYIGEPGMLSCILQPNCLGFVSTVCVSVLYIKTKHILNVFTSKLAALGDIRSKKRRTEQIEVASLIGLISVEVLSVALITYFLPPGPDLEFYPDNRVVKTCGRNWMTAHTVAVCYAASLQLVCITLAFRARKLPQNFNDARFISFTAFMQFLVWIGALQSFYGSIGSWQTVIICFAIIFAKLPILIFMIFPKMRTILWHPEKNTTEAIRNQTTNHIMTKHFAET